jgi:hypothetical protein
MSVDFDGSYVRRAALVVMQVAHEALFRTGFGGRVQVV